MVVSLRPTQRSTASADNKNPICYLLLYQTRSRSTHVARRSTAGGPTNSNASLNNGSMHRLNKGSLMANFPTLSVEQKHTFLASRSTQCRNIQIYIRKDNKHSSAPQPAPHILGLCRLEKHGVSAPTKKNKHDDSVHLSRISRTLTCAHA